MRAQHSKIFLVFLWRQNDWGLYKRRNESLLWELVRRNSVVGAIHIEPNSIKSTLLSIKNYRTAKTKPLKRAYGFQLRKSFSFSPLLVDKSEKVWGYSAFIVSSRRSPVIDWVRHHVLKVQSNVVNQWLAQLSDDIGVVAIAYPPATYLEEFLMLLDHDVLFADLVDDMIGKAEGNVKENFIESYQSLLPKCSWVFATSPTLGYKYGGYARQEIEFLPNGVDLDEFLMEDTIHPRRNKERVTVGYVGSINQTIDVEVLDHIVDCYPEVDFDLVGFATPDRLEQIRNMMRKYSNLHFLGRCHFSEVPACLARFDVLINLKKNDFTTIGNDSMKIYEYLATGKPIVSLPISPAGRFRDLIYVASDKHEFAKCLGEALGEESAELREARIKAAREESWAKRVDVILERVQSHLDR